MFVFALSQPCNDGVNFEELVIFLFKIIFILLHVLQTACVFFQISEEENITLIHKFFYTNDRLKSLIMRFLKILICVMHVDNLSTFSLFDLFVLGDGNRRTSSLFKGDS